jgi:hypothetical protein
MLPQLMRIFVSGDNAVEFEERRPESEGVAKEATGYINHLFFVRNDGVEIIYDWFKDALIQKVGFVKVWAEEDSEDDRQTFEGQAPEQLLMLMQDGWQLAGDPEQDEQGLTFTVVKNDRKVCIKVAVCAPHEVRVDPNARWGDEPAMIAHVFRKRRFELEEDGYDLSDVGTGSGDPSDAESIEMLGDAVEDGYTTPAESHQLYNCAEVYIKADRDGDGVAEWVKACMIEETLAMYADGKGAVEQVDDHPFVWICPIPRPHAFYGDCPADLALQPQKLRTNVVRAIVDNLYLSVNQRTYLNTDADVNIADWLENRPGGVVRGRGAPANAFQTIVQPSLAAPAYEFNEWLEGWKENRTGFTRYSQGTDANSLNKTATGVSIITQKSDARMELIARFCAVGMRKLFAKMLKLTVQHQNQPEMLKLNGAWTPIDPSEWKDQLNVSIKVGLGTGSKEQQAARIMALIQTQQLGVPMGVVGPENIAESIRLFAEANEFKNPERFVSPQPTGMPPNPQAYQAEKQQAMEQMQQMQQQLEQTSQENEQLKQQSVQSQQDNALKQAQLEQKAQEMDLKQRSTEADIALRQADMVRKDRETHIKGVETAHGMAHADIDAEQNAKIDALQQQIDELKAASAEPAQGEAE